MSLTLKYHKVTNASEAFQVVKKNVTPEAIAKFQVKAELSYDEGRKVIVAKGTGFTLTMSFNETEAVIDLDLSFLLRPLKGKVMASLEKQLSAIV